MGNGHHLFFDANLTTLVSHDHQKWGLLIERLSSSYVFHLFVTQYASRSGGQRVFHRSKNGYFVWTLMSTVQPMHVGLLASKGSSTRRLACWESSLQVTIYIRPNFQWKVDKSPEISTGWFLLVISGRDFNWTCKPQLTFIRYLRIYLFLVFQFSGFYVFHHSIDEMRYWRKWGWKLRQRGLHVILDVRNLISVLVADEVHVDCFEILIRMMWFLLVFSGVFSSYGWSWAIMKYELYVVYEFRSLKVAVSYEF